MTEHIVTKKQYALIFGILMVLTLVTTAIGMIDLGRAQRGGGAGDRGDQSAAGGAVLHAHLLVEQAEQAGGGFRRRMAGTAALADFDRCLLARLAAVSGKIVRAIRKTSLVSAFSYIESMPSADVVIIGGGIVGSSVAYHLTQAGCRNVVVLERESQQGKGSTGKSMGGVRAQFSTPVNIRMSLYSIPFFRAFDEAMGHPSGYRAQGYLFVATHARHLAVSAREL